MIAKHVRSKIRGEYDHWHEQMSRSDKDNPLVFPWHETVYRCLGQMPVGRLLEIGCGRGQFAIWLAQKRPDIEIVALDFSEVAINLAKEQAMEAQVNVKFVQGSAEDLQFEGESFDTVISCECMEHVTKPAKMAQEMARVLTPGGRFVLTTENYFNGMLLAWLVSWLRREPFNSGSGIQPIENFFLFWIVSGYLQNAGLVVSRTESSHYQWLLLPRVAPSILCTREFRAPWAKKLAKPFGRHFTYIGQKPVSP